MNKLEALSMVMDGYRKSFEYIQDYININSLKIWHEEVCLKKEIKYKLNFQSCKKFIFVVDFVYNKKCC